ncbi:transmembrane protein, putative (macronuclear) [Tetrahymena thermophila SB210]|uniref:Transmembrane protein, putative n=1 Tax=Tetrahymena thermophila (strain SB210) TaxID=312017 RepID=Q22SG5_TETTS|nr:transmembrane protein, putative [Tetrahymena thermophila SB210]EAR87807.2 transmembrane protein, putative [Tetrahymena thermophila SB210]|eukprot:XP_001008052.2 transmembrane protein, putative [Tetrahymena thermophila SB210]
MMNKICLRSFKKLDIFGSEIGLNYKKQNIFRSAFGGFVAIVCILVLVLLFFNNVLTLIQKTQVSVIDSVNYDPNPDIFEVGYNQMMIAVKFDQDNYIQRPKMNITFEKRHYIRHENGTLEQQKIPATLEPCTIEHFENLPNYNIDWKLGFQLSGLDDYLCLQKGESFKIGGRYESKDFYHIKFILSKCENQTDPVEPWKPICDTPENIYKTTEDARIRFIFSNTLLNPESSDTPIQTFQDSLIFNVQPQQMYTTANIMLNQQTVRTDESVTLFKDFQEVKFVSFKQGDYKQQFAVGNFTKYAEIFFLRSNFSTIALRTFLKIDQVISYMGGFCQIFLLFSAIIVGQVNEHIYDIELANQLYDFDIQNKSEANYKPVIKKNNSFQSRQSVKSNFSQNINAKILTEGDFTTRLNQFQNTKINQMQDSPKNFDKRNSFLQQNGILSQNNKGSLNVNSTLFKKESLNRQSPCFINQNEQKEENQINLPKEEVNQENQLSQRQDSTRPIYTQRNSNNSKFLNKDSPLINLDQNCYLQSIEPEQNKKQRNSLESDLQKQEEDKVIDISKINNQFQFQQKDQATNEKTFSKNNLNKIVTPNRISLFEIQSEGNVNKRINEQEQNLTQTFVLNHYTKERQEKSFTSENKQFLEQELKYIVQRDRSLQLNLKYFVNKISCGKFYNTYEVLLLNKAIDSVKQDLDIFNILERQKEIDKLKNLLFSHDQQVLFNFFPKPLIKLNKEGEILSRNSLRNINNSQPMNLSRLNKRKTKKLNLNIKNIAILTKAIMKFKENLSNKNISDYQQLFNCYEKIVMQQDTSEVEKILNKKLIDQLGSEMKNIFEIAYMMKQKQLKKEQNTSFNRINQIAPSQNNILNPSLFQNFKQRQQNICNTESNSPSSSQTNQNQEKCQESVPKINEISFEKAKQTEQQLGQNQFNDNQHQDITNQLIQFEQDDDNNIDDNQQTNQIHQISQTKIDG